MKKTIHMISGLPRAGSTLLCNILLQNPKFHATATSGCMDVLFSIRNNWHNLFQHQASPCPQKLKNVTQSVLEAYYQDVYREVIFDKSRGWLPYIEFIEEVTETKMKILVPMRPIPDILASMETLYRETSKVKQPPGEAKNYFQFQTVKGRCEYWMRKDQVVGLTLDRIKDAISRGYRDRLFFIDFDALTSKPKETVESIYNFLGEPYYNHDFNNVKQVTSEDDEIHGFVNLHTIRSKVEPVKSRALEVLGKDVIQQLKL